MDRETQPEFIESTAGQVAAEFARRGVPQDQRVTITIEPDDPDDWIAKARKFACPKVIAEGWTDADIDRVIKEERKAVRPALIVFLDRYRKDIFARRTPSILASAYGSP